MLSHPPASSAAGGTARSPVGADHERRTGQEDLDAVMIRAGEEFDGVARKHRFRRQLPHGADDIVGAAAADLGGHAIEAEGVFDRTAASVPDDHVELRALDADFRGFGPAGFSQICKPGTPWL